METDDSVSTTDDVDWTPAEFKKEHPNEWAAVKQAIDVQQKGGDIDYRKIDKIVRTYITAKQIVLPKDAYSQIKKIEEICKNKFDISGYDDSNMGGHIADGTTRLFEQYVNWLLEKEAKRVKGTGINIQEEKKMVKAVMDAFYNCCDSMEIFTGSGAWVGWSEVSRMKENFYRSMCVALLKPQGHKTMPLLLTPQHFKKECATRIANYNSLKWEEAPSPQTFKQVLDLYCNAMAKWLEYRNKVEKGIQNPVLKSDYGYLTRTFAKVNYIHLKNDTFGDIGMCSDEMSRCYLPLDCSDKEMLNYSFEKAYNEYVSSDDY